MNTFSAIIIGAASGAIAIIVASKFLNWETDGGGQPRQGSRRSYTARHGRVDPQVPDRLPVGSAPLVQNTPITEAAYNVQPTNYETTLGPEQNQSNTALTLPM